MRLEHTTTRSRQNGVCLVELRRLYSKHKIQQRMNKENTTT